MAWLPHLPGKQRVVSLLCKTKTAGSYLVGNLVHFWSKLLKKFFARCRNSDGNLSNEDFVQSR